MRAGINAFADEPISNTTGNVGLLLNYVYDDGGRLDAQIKSVEKKSQIRLAEIDLKIRSRI